MFFAHEQVRQIWTNTRGNSIVDCVAGSISASTLSTSTRKRARMTEEKKLSLHWLTVGYVSPQAKQWIEECGGSAKQVNEEPALFLVALAYDPAGKWVWSKGRQQLRAGIEFWSSGEIQEASTGITLQYRNIDRYHEPHYESAEENYLILPDEEYDPATGKVKEPGQYKLDAELPELPGPDDHPF